MTTGRRSQGPGGWLAVALLATAPAARADLARDHVSYSPQGDLERAWVRIEQTPHSARTTSGTGARLEAAGADTVRGVVAR